MTTIKTPPPTSETPVGEAGTLIGSGQEGTVSDQVRAWLQRVRGGDMGALPAVGGLLVLSIMFAFLSPFFLTERNFANLLTQAATLVTLAMALTFVILLGEIDLSAGVTSGARGGHLRRAREPGRPRSPLAVALWPSLWASASPPGRSSDSSSRGSGFHRSS